MPDNSSLQDDVEAAVKAYERFSGHPATRTRQMLAAYGPVEALTRLVSSAELQSGFKTLVRHDEAKLTFEAVIIKHAQMFRPDVAEAAKFRLREAGVDLGPA